MATSLTRDGRTRRRLDLVGARSWVDVDPRRRRVAAPLHRGHRKDQGDLQFTARTFLRIIGQLVETRRDPSLHTFEVAPRDAVFTASVLFAYKINWQTVLFQGYDDNRTLLEGDHSAKTGHQFFLKVSYAFQK